MVGNMLVWMTNDPGKMGKGPQFQPTIASTDGCSCKQILDEMQTTTGEDLGGQYFFGCTKGTLQDWERMGL